MSEQQLPHVRVQVQAVRAPIAHSKDLDTVTKHKKKWVSPKHSLGHITAKSMQSPPVATYFSSLFPMFSIYFHCSQSTEQRLKGSILDQRWKVDIRIFSLDMALRFY